jgi:hypothetical protein
MRLDGFLECSARRAEIAGLEQAVDALHRFVEGIRGHGAHR